jgi:hypothetical protein
MWNQKRFLLILTATNLAILAWLLAGPQLVSASPGSGIVRGTALEIVDDHGRVRASLGIVPTNTPGVVPSDNGAGEGTVLLRLIYAAGQPSLKIAVSESASGISLVGGNDDSYIVIEADGPASELRLVKGGGETRVIAP